MKMAKDFVIETTTYKFIEEILKHIFWSCDSNLKKTEMNNFSSASSNCPFFEMSDLEVTNFRKYFSEWPFFLVTYFRSVPLFQSRPNA